MSDDNGDKVRKVFDEAEDIDDVEGARGDDPTESATLPADEDAWRHDLPEDHDELVAQAARYPLNDYGNGQRLKLYYGRNTLFVPRLGWFRWQGQFWQADEDELAVRADAQKIAGRILEEVPYIHLEDWERSALDTWAQSKPELDELDKVKPSDLTEEMASRRAILWESRNRAQSVMQRLQKAKASHGSHSKNTGNTSKITNMLMECRVASATTVDALNADPMMVNCQNGTLRFVRDIDPHDADWGDVEPKWRVEHLDHDRTHLISKMMVAEYHRDAKCPYWLRFLEKVIPDPDERAFLQRWFGLTITGIKTEQKLVFLYGVGRNGKSTMIDIIARIMADYGTTIPIETLTGADQRKGSDATPDLVRLPGARLVRASEPEQGQRMKEALIKSLTGGEPIMIRRMQQEFVEITPEFKLTISGNHKPDIRGADDGIWRRIMLVNFGVQIPEDEVDETLSDKLWAERDGILAWLVEGCLDYLSAGLRPPASVRDATEEYRQDSDPLRVFLQTECDITGATADFVKGIDLQRGFNAWLLSKGEAAWGPRTVANGIKQRAGIVKSSDGHTFKWLKRSDSGYVGIRLNYEARDRIEDFKQELDNVMKRRG